MDYRYSPDFKAKYKRRKRKKDVRLCSAIDETIELFSSNSNDKRLKSHPLERELTGLRSIHIIGLRTNDYCMVYEEKIESDGSKYAYFLQFGTHTELFG